MTVDESGPADPNAGLFGLTDTPDTATVVCIPVPFEATVSYRAGCARGPEAIRRASHQVDLFDPDVGTPWRAGIALLDPPEWLPPLAHAARSKALRVIEAAATQQPTPEADLADVTAAGARIDGWLFEEVKALLDQGKLPVVIGGDHSVPEGALRACAAHVAPRPLGVLHLDAHLDLRVAYEGFQHSHASIMHNALAASPNLKLVQFGIRDFSADELAQVSAEAAKGTDGRIATWFDVQLRAARQAGGMAKVAESIAAALPDDVYLSFDIDGLDPALCPGTGTPVPGGVSFDDVVVVLDAVLRAGKRVVGLDLVEVGPPATASDDELGDGWDENVGARLLHKMIGYALLSRGVGQKPRLPVPPGS
jgi:agmatinase